MNSYHDVEIGCKNRIYKMMNVPFSHQLNCTRSAGWELWELCNGSIGCAPKDERVGGEYSDAPFEIRIHDAVICHNRFITPVDIDTLEMSTADHITLGLLSLPTLWDKSKRELRVTFNDTQLSAYADMAAYVLRFGGLWYAGYFWTAELLDAFTMIDKKSYAIFQLTEPKTDGN